MTKQKIIYSEIIKNSIMADRYIPDQKIIDRYAKVMVHFAIGNGRGVKKGEVVRVVCEEPLCVPAQQVWMHQSGRLAAGRLDLVKAFSPSHKH